MKILLLIIVTILLIQPVNAQIDYFGQTPPGNTAVKFAPGIISLDNRLEDSITFSPDGNECYFTVYNSRNYSTKIYYTKRINNTWSEQKEAPFSASSNSNYVSAPYITADGSKLYFSKGGNIWMVERIADEWGEAQILPAPINSNNYDEYYSETVDGDIYFSSDRAGGHGQWGDIWHKDHSSNQAENLGPIINSKSYQYSPCIAHDGSYLIFQRESLTDDRFQELVISFKNGNNEWTVPVNMEKSGAKINIPRCAQICPSLSPDGRYLFFARHDDAPTMTDIYWVSTNIIDNLKNDVLSVVDESKKEVRFPHSIELNQNYPNPFNPTTTIYYSLNRSGQVRLIVYNMLGQRIRSLFDGHQHAGTYRLTWNGLNESGYAVDSGVYYYQLKSDDMGVMKKMILAK